MSNCNSGYNYTVTELFEAQANNLPNQIAVNCQGTTLTYLALNEKANKLAYWLKNNHIVSGDVVGLLLEPGLDFIISLLAIIKTGAVYLSLDSLAPQQRLRDIIEDACPTIIITNDEHQKTFLSHHSLVRLIKKVHLESAAYSPDNLRHKTSSSSPLSMIYTSGSTGRPKGVVIPHQAIVNLIKVEHTTHIKSGDSIAQFSNLAFDGSVFEIWCALLNGATLFIVPLDVRYEHNKFKMFLDDNQVGYLFLPTGYFHQLIKSAINTLDAVHVLVIGGEQANAPFIEKFLSYRKQIKKPIQLINGYGPTETTAYTCRHIMNENSVMNEEQLSSIGTPIQNTRIYILDEQNNPASEGELCISGVNLAIGYHNCLEQNKEKFIKNPFCQEEPFHRLYKTGDRARQLPSGEFVCLGRLDDQVKIGGFRIHLNEIEYHLMQFPSISLAAVKVEVGGGSHHLLSAYIVLSSADTVIHADDIRAFLSNILPPYMVPAKYNLVDELPLTAVGKVDKAKLESIPHTDLTFHETISSISLIEKQIGKIWQYLLNRNSIDVNKNLFELGANSLLITEACARINESLQSKLEISHILSYPTIHKLSRYLEGDIKAPVVKKIKSIDSSEIAIIGMSCRFPGAKSLDEFWDNLCQGKECLERFSEKQLAENGIDYKLQNSNFVPVRGILSEIEQFDAHFFGFSPVDASITDPQQRLFLECSWEALEHAGVAPSKVGSKTISVFAGMADSTYLHENILKNNWYYKEHDRFQQRMASSTGILSTQVSYRFNLTGRSVNINTACSTGLVTVSEACQELILGNSDIALAGAVSIVVPQIDGYIYKNGSIDSPDGQCRPFAHHANGTVFSNGVGVVILKRLTDAIADNDTIYAVINGSGVNNDGSDKLGYTAPSVSGQIGCISEALRQSGVDAQQIGYVEAHGTATALGDVVEMDALSRVYSEHSKKKQFCALGSVKGNIGHTDVAAGIAGLIKTTLCLYYQKIPPTLHFEKPNPNISLTNSPFFINSQLIDWNSEGNKRYASVSAFGVGGTNAHLILSEHQQELTSKSGFSEQVIILSAKTENALEHSTQKLIKHLSCLTQETSTNYLADMAYTLQTGREEFQWRRIGAGKSTNELIKNLSNNPIRLCPEGKQRGTVFMFPGQGAQYRTMALQLMDEIPYFSRLVHQGIELAKHHLNCDLLSVMSDLDDTRLHETQYAQPALFIIEYALAKLLIHYGIEPAAFVGHSLGEYVAACLAGVFSFEDAIALVCKRGLLMASVSRGSMLAIECTVEEFTAYTKNFDVDLALHNTSNHCVAAGTSLAVAQLEDYLKKIGIAHQKLKVSHAFHSRFMEEIELSFKDLFANITLHPPQIPMVSNVTGDWLSIKEATDPDYWYRHLRQTVQLSRGLVTLINDEYSLFIEIGPGHSLGAFLKKMASTHDTAVCSVHTLPNKIQNNSDSYQLLLALGILWQEGISVNWPLLYENEKRGHIALPTYSFQKQRYWIEPDAISTPRDTSSALYKPVWSHQCAYLENRVLSKERVKEHSWIIFKDGKGIGEHFISVLKQHGTQPIIIEPGKQFVKLSATHFKINLAEKDHYLEVAKSIKNSINNPILLHLCTCNELAHSILSSTEIDAQLSQGFYSVLYFIQAYIEHIGDHIPLRGGLITTGTQQVLGTEAICPINASLIGFCRVATLEHTLLQFRVLDIDPAEQFVGDGRIVGKIIDSCVNEDWEVQPTCVAYRNGYEWRMNYIKEESQDVIHRLRDNGVYLLTGGLGGIALNLCEAIAKSVTSPKFILISRNSILAEDKWDEVLCDSSHPLYKKISVLKKLQESGAQLFIHQADVTHVESLVSIINYYKMLFGTINGLIHAAGIPGGGLIQLKSKQLAQAVFAPKIHGTYNLAHALQKIPLDFVVLLSSIAVLTGEIGQVDYCGANASLDAFAVSQLFLSSYVVSLNWNTWQDVGMAVETKQFDGAAVFDKGNNISPQLGQQLFLKAIQSGYSNLMISNYDLESYVKILKQHKELSGLSQMKIARDELNISADYCPPGNEVEEQLAHLWQNTLGIESVGVKDDFFALGGHSLKALTLIEKINNQFHCSLVINHLYGAPTIAQLGVLISSEEEEKQIDIIVPLKENEEKQPKLFLCHPALGMIYCFDPLVSQWTLPVSIVGLQDPSVASGTMLYESIESMARAYLRAIKKVQSEGPYYLMGYSLGGTIMYEVAHMLQQQREPIGLLALIDSWAKFSPLHQNAQYFKERLSSVHVGLPQNLIDLAWLRMELLLSHTPTKMEQNMLLFKATELVEEYQAIDHPLNGWSYYNRGSITCHRLDANHETILNAKNSQQIIHVIKKMGIFNKEPVL